MTLSPAATPASRTPATGRPPEIVPLVIPHGLCGSWCPLCPPVMDAANFEAMMAGPADVRAAMERYAPRTRRDDGATERTLLSFYGGSMASLSHRSRSSLLDAGEREFRSSRIAGMRVVCDLTGLFRVPLDEWRVRGVRSLEVPLLSMHPAVCEGWGGADLPERAERAVQKAHWLDLEIGIQLMPGLPGDSHARSVAGARALADLRPSYVRILPALVLEGTRLEHWWRELGWVPMSLAQAEDTCGAMLNEFRAANVPVARIGLQPEFDLLRGPRVLDGPYHPSLRHRVESRRFREMALNCARQQAFQRSLELLFHPADESYLRGAGNKTLIELRRRFRFEIVRLSPDRSLPRGTLVAGRRS